MPTAPRPGAGLSGFPGGSGRGSKGETYSGPPPHIGDGDRSELVLRRLQLTITHKLDGLLQGDYLGLLPGPGSENGESREYRPGDDVRRMDWPVTARTTVPHVRQTVADRELETWVCVDLSASLDFGTTTCEKRDLALAALAAISHLAVRGGNRLGAVVATGERNLWLPARPGRQAAQHLVRRVARTPRAAAGAPTDLAGAVSMLSRPPRRRGQAVVISDFLTPDVENPDRPPDWERELRRLSVRHDLLAIEVVDPRELELPDVGMLTVVDPETGQTHEVHTGDRRFRERYAEEAKRQRGAIAWALRRAGAAHLRLRTDSDWLVDIVRFVAAQRRGQTRGTTR